MWRWILLLPLAAALDPLNGGKMSKYELMRRMKMQTTTEPVTSAFTEMSGLGPTTPTSANTIKSPPLTFSKPATNPKPYERNRSDCFLMEGPNCMPPSQEAPGDATADSANTTGTAAEKRTTAAIQPVPTKGTNLSKPVASRTPETDYSPGTSPVAGPEKDEKTLENGDSMGDKLNDIRYISATTTMSTEKASPTPDTGSTTTSALGTESEFSIAPSGADGSVIRTTTIQNTATGAEKRTGVSGGTTGMELTAGYTKIEAVSHSTLNVSPVATISEGTDLNNGQTTESRNSNGSSATDVPTGPSSQTTKTVSEADKKPPNVSNGPNTLDTATGAVSGTKPMLSTSSTTSNNQNSKPKDLSTMSPAMGVSRESVHQESIGVTTPPKSNADTGLRNNSTGDRKEPNEGNSAVTQASSDGDHTVPGNASSAQNQSKDTAAGASTIASGAAQEDKNSGTGSTHPFQSTDADPSDGQSKSGVTEDRKSDTGSTVHSQFSDSSDGESESIVSGSSGTDETTSRKGIGTTMPSTLPKNATNVPTTEEPFISSNGKRLWIIPLCVFAGSVLLMCAWAQLRTCCKKNSNSKVDPDHPYI